MITIAFTLLGLVLGFFAGIKYLNIKEKIKSDKKFKESENIVLEFSKKEFTFKNRVGNYVYFTSDSGNQLLYAVKEREIIIFNRDSTILTSTGFCKGKISDMFVNMIESKFKKELNEKMIDFNGMKIHEGFFKKDIFFTEKITETPSQSLSIDKILDKINEKGINSLTKEEINFLKKQ